MAHTLANDDLTSRPGRDLRLDALRGLMLVFMTINHIPTNFKAATSESLGFVSDAEGFVFLSGLVAGIVYTRKINRPNELSRATWMRAGQLYAWHLAAYFFVLVGVAAFGMTGFWLETWFPMFYDDPVQAAMQGPLFLCQPGLLNILPLYVGFFLPLPFLMRAFASGRARWVLGASVGLWATAQFLRHMGPEWIGNIWLARLLPFDGYFSFFGWQLLFVGGLWLGYWKTTHPGWQFRPNRVLVVAGFLVVAAFFLVRHELVRFPEMTAIEWIRDKRTLPLVRVVNFAVVTYLIAAAMVVWPRFMAIRSLAFLGEHSLAVFSAHIMLLFLAAPTDVAYPNQITDLVTTCSVVAALFGVAYLDAWFKDQQRRPAPALASA